MRIPVLAAALLVFTLPAAAQEAPDTRALVDRHSHPFTLDEHDAMAGPGAEHLRQATRGAQYFLFGEDHHDHDTPRLAGAIYRIRYGVR